MKPFKHQQPGHDKKAGSHDASLVLGIRRAGHAAISESMAAVSAVLDAVPDNIVRMPTSVADAFLLVDPVLSMINRQLLDARRHTTSIAGMFGDDDAMMEALTLQITALEQAYAARMAALARRREEGRSQLAPRKDALRTRKTEITNLEAGKPMDVRQQVERQNNKNDALWSWVLFLLLYNQASRYKKSGPRLEAA